MKIIIQRVTEACVTVEQKVAGKIGRGLLVLVGFTSTDTLNEIEHLSNKILKLRLWPNKKDVRWAESVTDQTLEILCVSQFTLYTTLKGNKPDFHLAMDPDNANKMYEIFLETMKKKYKPEKIQSGVFGGYMNVSLVNDGPVTISLEYPQKSDVSDKIIPQESNKKKDSQAKLKKDEEKKAEKIELNHEEINKFEEECLIKKENDINNNI